MKKEFEEWLHSESIYPFYAEVGYSHSNFGIIQIARNEKCHLLFGQKNKTDQDLITSEFGFAGLYLPKEGTFYYVSRDFKKALANIGYSKEEMEEHSIASLQTQMRKEIEAKVEELVDNNKQNLSVQELKTENYLYELAKLDADDLAMHQAQVFFDKGTPIAYRAVYNGKKWNMDTVFSYIHDPEGFVDRLARDFIERNEEEILLDLLRNEKINREYRKLEEEKEYQLPIARTIHEALEKLPVKSIEVSLKKEDQLLKFDMETKAFDDDRYQFSPSYILQPNRRIYLDLIGNKDFYPDEIQGVYYQSKPVYEKEYIPAAPDDES